MYYKYEIEMPEEDYRRLCDIAAKENLTPTELVLRQANHLIDHPDEYRKWCDDHMNLSEKQILERIKLIRYYPVLEGQTEEEARAIALEKEANEKINCD